MLRDCLRLSIALPLLALASACTTVRVDQLRNAETVIDPTTDRVVVLGRNESAEFETESSLVDCVGGKLAGGASRLQVINQIQFIDALYPWFEPRTAPLQPERLEQYLQEPLIRDRIESFGIRYIVWISGATETIDSAGALSCGITAGAAGCFGFSTWEEESNYEASIWDFRELRESGRISTDARGTSYLPAVIIPVPLLARVQGNACDSMGDQRQQFFQPVSVGAVTR